jgi:hypothetical protein
MPRADQAQRVSRVNIAFRWLQAGLSPPEVTQKLAAEIGISSRQAYRYVTEAQQIDAPMAEVEAKAVFTVKLPQSLITRLHRYSESTGQTLSQIVSHALLVFFRRGGRG